MRHPIIPVSIPRLVALALTLLAIPTLADPPAAPNHGLLGQEQRRQAQDREFLRRHSDSSGRARPDLWAKGVAHAKQMPVVAGIGVAAGRKSAAPSAVQTIGAPQTSSPQTTSSVVGVQWTQVGPAPLRIDAEQNFQGAGPDSGQVTDIAIDPRNASDMVVYIASNDGGVWKSTDGGTSWTPKTDYKQSLSMGALVLDPGNPSIVYAGTGNLFNNGFFKGVGVYKSIDGGDTWSTVGAGVLSGKGVNRMTMPAANVLLVGTNSGLYRSVDGGLNFGNNSPSFNNGSPVRGGFISDLKVDTANASVVYAAVSGSGVFASTDGGATFSGTALFSTGNLTGGATNLAFISFAQSVKPDNKTVYLSVQTPATCTRDSSGNLIAGAICAQVYKSTDTGGSWTNMPDAQGRAFENGGCQCGYDQTIAVDPQDVNRVYIGYQELYASTDGAGTFPTPAASRNKIHWDHHALTFSPSGHWGGGGAPTRLWIGTDGGVHSTSDGGGTFANLNEGIATNLFRQIDIGRGSTANNAYTYGGTQDTGIIEHRPAFAGNDWHLGIDGDGGPTAVDPCNASHAISTDDGGYNQTTNAGANWAGGGGFPAKSSQGVMAFDANCGRVYIAVYTPVVGPPASTTIQMFVSTDNGNNFSTMSTFNQSITAIATSKLDSNTLWIGLNDGTVARTANALAATPTWTTINVTGAPGQAVTALAIDPANTSQVVVVYPGFSGISPNLRTRHVFMTSDNGGSWTDISGTDGGNPTQNLPDLPLSSVVIDGGTSPHAIIVSGDAGVMRSADGGASWQVFGVGLPTVDSTSLQIDPSVTPSLLRLGTYGRSTFELTSASGPMLAVNADLGFGTVPLGVSVSRVVQIFNVGSSDLHISSFTRVAGSTDFAIVSGPATPVTVTPGEEIDYTIAFRPTVSGNETATFQINSDDPFQPARQLPASGTGGAPKIGVNADLTFGTVAVGLSASRVVQFFNTGTSDLHISGFVRLSGSPDFTVSSGPATPVTVAPGSEVDFTVRFAPSSAGSKSAVFQATSDDPTTPTVSLNATGIGGTGKAVLSSTSLAFGKIAVDDRTAPNISDQVLTITNQAFCTGCDLHILAMTITGPNAGDFSLVAPPALPATIAAANTLPLTVRFNPSNVGSRNATLTVSTDDPAAPTLSVALAGTGLIPAIGVSPATLIFPPTVYDPVCGIACGMMLSDTVTNTGQAELILDTLSVSGTGFSTPAATIPPTRLGLGAQVAVPVTFHPTGAAARIVTGNLHIQDNMGPAPTAAPVAADVPLCGEAVGRGIRVLAINGTGTPFTTLKSLSLKSSGITQVVNIGTKTLTLTDIEPPASCQSILFQYENQDLPATDSTNKKSMYTLSVSSAGGHTTTQTFTLGVNEFKILVVTIN